MSRSLESKEFFLNYDQDQVMIKIGEKENKRMHHIIKKSSKKSKTIKERWSHNEDILLLQLVERNGTTKWREIAKMFKGRRGKQCRERWHNHLRPDIKKNIWTEEEDRILVEAHKEVGNKWTLIAERLPGRSENTVKNHWNATKRREHLWRTKGKDLSCTNVLMNYIRSIAEDNNSTMNTQNASPTVTNATIQEFNNIDDDDFKFIDELLMNPSLEAEMQTSLEAEMQTSLESEIQTSLEAEMQTSLEAELQTTTGSTTSTYSPTSTNYKWEDDFSEIAEYFDHDPMSLTSDEIDQIMKDLSSNDNR